MKNCLYILFLFLLFCAGGCLSPALKPQEELALRLNVENSVSLYCTRAEPARTMLKNYATQAELALTDLQDHTLALEVSSLLAILYQASGLEDLSACGASSRLLFAEQNENLYLNRFCALYSPESDGYLWRMFPSTPHDFTPFAADLPAGTILAAAFLLEPQHVAAVVEKYGDKLPEAFAAECQQKFRKSPQELLENFSGRWELVLFEENGRPHIRISIPDREMLLAPYRELANILIKRFSGEQEFPQAEVFSRDGLFILATQQKDSQSPRPTLRETSPEYAEFLKQLPPEGAGFLYWSEAFSRVLLPPESAIQQNAKVPMFFGVAENTGRSVEFTALCNCDISELKMFGMLQLPLRYGALLLWKNRQETMQFARQQQAQAAAAQTARTCAEQLKELYPALKDFARKHNGKFPDMLTDLPLDGEKLLCPEPDSAYFYMPGMTLDSNPEFPLLFDSVRHGNLVNVLLVNGEILSLDLNGDLSPKRMISILQTRFRYPEKELQMLLKKINTADETMEF